MFLDLFSAYSTVVSRCIEKKSLVTPQRDFAQTVCYPELFRARFRLCGVVLGQRLVAGGTRLPPSSAEVVRWHNVQSADERFNPLQPLSIQDNLYQSSTIVFNALQPP